MKDRARKKREKYEREFGDKADYIRSLPCIICHAPGPSDPHHVRTVGAGGTSKDLIPICRIHHQQIHTIGVKTFQQKYNVNLRERADRYEEWYNNDPQDLAF